MHEYKQVNTRFEVKELTDSGTIEGYGSVFGVIDNGMDEVMPGAFSETIKSHKANNTAPKMLWQHNPDQPVGKWTEYEEDGKGLHMRGKLLINDDPLAKTAYAHLKENTIDGMSIGFVVEDYSIRKEDGQEIREIKSVDLWEVSLVTFPMNSSARVENVKAIDCLRSLREFEAALRDVLGLSRKEAKAIAAYGWSGLQRDADSEVIATLLNNLRGNQ